MKSKKIKYKKIFFLTFISFLLFLGSGSDLLAHGGGLNKAGCHNDKRQVSKTNNHCHNKLLGKSLKQNKKVTQSKKNKRFKSAKKNENYYNDLYAEKVEGRREVKHKYKYEGGVGKVLVDIETETEVIEGGKDKRSSLDSLQQALFFSVLTGKKPVVVIYDTDGKMGKYEYRIERACKAAGVEYRRVKL